MRAKEQMIIGPTTLKKSYALRDAVNVVAGKSGTGKTTKTVSRMPYSIEARQRRQMPAQRRV